MAFRVSPHLMGLCYRAREEVFVGMTGLLINRLDQLVMDKLTTTAILRALGRGL